MGSKIHHGYKKNKRIVPHPNVYIFSQLWIYWWNLEGPSLKKSLRSWNKKSHRALQTVFCFCFLKGEKISLNFVGDLFGIWSKRISISKFPNKTLVVLHLTFSFLINNYWCGPKLVVPAFYKEKGNFWKEIESLSDITKFWNFSHPWWVTFWT